MRAAWMKRSEVTKKYVLRFTAILACTTVLSILLSRAGVGKENTLMVFMVGVLLITAFTGGYQYGIVGSISSVMIFNFFFTAPLHTFAITNTNDIVLIVFFLLASFISSSLTVRFQQQLKISEQNVQIANLLYEMSESFINVTGRENIVELGIQYIYEHTHYESAVELLDETVVDDVKGEYTSKDFMMFPIIGLTKQIGILRVYNHNQGLTKEEELLIKTAANQTGIALDREMIYAQQEETKVQMEREHMKSSMLRSISHDFRTPLTGIIGDCGYLLESEELEKETVKQLAGDISEQSMWLMKMMENVLSMTKIESGQFFVDKQPEVVDDIINEAVTHVIGLKEKRRFSVSLPDDVIVVDADGRMLIQVVINLLDNAVKHTKENGKISLGVSYRGGKAFFQVEDDGEGIETGMEEKIFDEFVSLSGMHSDKKRGIGLGLTICKAVVDAHGGGIWAENRIEGGARFMFWLEARQVGIDG